MSPRSDRLPSVIERLRAEGLIPPVKSVEVGGGGWIRVTVLGDVEPDFRARLAAAIGHERWTLVEPSDDRAADASLGR